MRSKGKGGLARGFRAMLISFMGLSSAAVRLERRVPQRVQRWTMAAPSGVTRWPQTLQVKLSVQGKGNIFSKIQPDSLDFFPPES